MEKLVLSTAHLEKINSFYTEINSNHYGFDAEQTYILLDLFLRSEETDPSIYLRGVFSKEPLESGLIVEMNLLDENPFAKEIFNMKPFIGEDIHLVSNVLIEAKNSNNKPLMMYLKEFERFKYIRVVE